MKLKSAHVAAITLAVIFGGISMTSLLDIWQTTGSKIPASYEDGAFAGRYNPADIRGSYTFQNITDFFKIPLDDLGIAFGLKNPESYAAFQCKELETLYSGLGTAKDQKIGVDSVRYFVALYSGLPIGMEDVYLPEPAGIILKKKASLTAEQLQAIEARSIPLGTTAAVLSETPQK